MVCNYFNMEKWYDWLEKLEAEKRKITNVPGLYEILKEECGLEKTISDQTRQSGEQTQNHPSE